MIRLFRTFALIACLAVWAVVVHCIWLWIKILRGVS